jgi:bifunctional non-homologous end joining protein LigD
MTRNETIKSESLAYNDIASGGSSDKVYHLSMDKVDGGYTVTAQYGRRGGPLATDDKTKPGPVSLAEAEKIFDKTLRSKLAKGYQPTGSPPAAAAVVYRSAPPGREPKEWRFQKELPQELLTEVQESEAAVLVLDDRYLMQDKSDGHSRGVVKRGGEIYGLNKSGLRVPLAETLVAVLEKIKLETFHIDAELVSADEIVARDILDADGDVSRLPYMERLVTLVRVVTAATSRNSTDHAVERRVRVVETWDGADNKAAALEMARDQRREGVVFKLKSAPHRAGRNGQHKKFKFVKTLSAIAGKPRATGKDSVDVLLVHGDPASDKVRVASVSLIGKPEVKEGDVIEVAYLYAFPSKKLAQPRLLRVRDDVHWTECTTDQLVYKREDR